MKRRFLRWMSVLSLCSILLCSLPITSFATRFVGRLDRMLVNPGFEDGREGWTHTGSSVNFFIHDDTDPDSIIKVKISHSGHHAAILVGSPKVSFSQEVTFPEKYYGMAYIFGVHVRKFLNINIQTTATLVATDVATGLVLNQSEPLELLDEYQLLTLAFLPEYENRTVRLELIVQGTAIVDDFSLDIIEDTYPILQNPGFEYGLTGWTEPETGFTQAFTTDAQANSGKSSLWISCFPGGPAISFPIKQTIPADQGHYTLFSWIKMDGADSSEGVASFMVRTFDKNGEQLNIATYTPFLESNTKEWQRIRLELEAPAEVDHIEVSVITINFIGSLYVDDVMLYYYDSTVDSERRIYQ